MSFLTRHIGEFFSVKKPNKSTKASGKKKKVGKDGQENPKPTKTNKHHVKPKHVMSTKIIDTSNEIMKMYQ